ncbi:MAG: class I SAM-dependent methyltransferase [Acidimicrobiia bacterium]
MNESAESSHSAERVYGEAWADDYDAIYDEVDERMIDRLFDLAGPTRRSLELAVGTGRVAIPLSERGVDVSGIDISESMLARLAVKPGGEKVGVTLGDMVEVPVKGTFPLVFVVANSLFVISTQERQVRCFQNVADHLEPGGRFLVECFVPDVKRFDSQNTRMAVSEIGDDGAYAYEVVIHDPVQQEVRSLHIRNNADGASRALPVTIRYAWPSELDLMARFAGLELESRWGWYDQREFTETSTASVSVYRKV